MKRFFIVIIAAVLALYVYTNQVKTKVNHEAISQFKLHKDNLVLVNKQTPYQEEPIKLVPLEPNIVSNVRIDARYYVEEQLVSPLKSMFEAAKRDGVNDFRINSAYRSSEEQAIIFMEKGSHYALPSGFSEHETGLSLDIGSTQGTMDKTIEGRWLAQHAHKYGFILRYPQHKEHITGILFEPWHFRYVGLPHSEIMYEEDLVLEEYLEWLKHEGVVTKKVNGIKYKVEYVQEPLVRGSLLPNNTVSSLDNTGGIIHTSIEN